MATLNKVILIGNLTADPELKQTGTGLSVCSFSIAVQRRFAKNQEGQQTADFINIVAWRQQAEFVCNYFKKGRPILVCGSLQSRSWTDQNNQKRYATEVVAEEVGFVDSKPQESTIGSSNPRVQESFGAPSFNNAGQGSSKFEEIKDDDSLPF